MSGLKEIICAAGEHAALQNSTQACKTYQYISPNVLQRPEQLQNNCNIVCPPGQQTPLWGLKCHQSLSTIKAEAVLQSLTWHGETP